MCLLKTLSWDFGKPNIRVICDHASFLPYPSESYMVLMKVKGVVKGSKLTDDKYKNKQIGKAALDPDEWLAGSDRKERVVYRQSFLPRRLSKIVSNIN